MVIMKSFGDEENKPGNKKKNFFSIRVVKGWNQLPDSVKGSMTLYAFKNRYDEHRNTAMDPE